MRTIFLLGGFVGFAAVAIAGLQAQRGGDLVLRDAAFGALGGALLFRWFWSIYLSALSDAVRAKRAARAAAAEAAAENSKQPPSAAAKPAPAMAGRDRN